MKADKTRVFLKRESSGAVTDQAPVVQEVNICIKELHQLESISESHDNSIAKLKDLISYGEQQWDGQPINKGMLEGLREALKIMEGV